MIVYIIKIPTELDKRVVGPIKADAQDYTVCKENESGYGGDYPLSYEIVNYYVPNPHGYISVP
ncbi:MAG: hypothetical protein U9Q83_09605, partial [Bacteroidota bacterium]|nr:hypothetical protein [Bacteroidota bacterium]